LALALAFAFASSAYAYVYAYADADENAGYLTQKPAVQVPAGAQSAGITHLRGAQ